MRGITGIRELVECYKIVSSLAEVSDTEKYKASKMRMENFAIEALYTHLVELNQAKESYLLAIQERTDEALKEVNDYHATVAALKEIRDLAWRGKIWR